MNYILRMISLVALIGAASPALAEGPDLVMTNVTPNASTANQGGTLSVTDTVANVGTTATSGIFRIAYYLSLDSAGATNDVAISTVRVRTTSMDPAATDTATTTLNIGSTAPGGTYYLCATADSINQVAEADEDNNTLCSSATVTLPQADLVMSNVSPTTTTVAPGGYVPVSNTVNNAGGYGAGTFKVGFYLSYNSDGSSTDVILNTTRTLATLGGGSSSPATTSLSIPGGTSDGIYYVCALADVNDDVAESNEGNNTLCSSTTIAVQTISFASPDLIMADVTPNASTANQGGTLSVTDTVENLGPDSTSGAFRIAYYLSADSAGVSHDVAISTIRVRKTAMMAGETDTATTILTIRSTAPGGTFYLCASADSFDQVSESDETNNTLCSNTTVSLPQPDLVMTDVSTTASTVAAGAILSVSNTVKNQGGFNAGVFRIGFYLSLNSDGSTQDELISTRRTLISLGAGASSPGTTSLRIPGDATPASYYVCAIADSLDNVDESNEGNNTLCSSAQVDVQ